LTLILLIVLVILVFPPCYTDESPPVSAGENSVDEGPVRDVSGIRRKAEEIVGRVEKSGDIHTRLEIAQTIDKVGSDADLYGLCEEAVTDGNVRDRMDALQAIVRDARLAAYSDRLYSALLQDSAYVIRERAVYHLSLDGKPSHIPIVRKALEDEDYYVRAQAARALGRYGDRDSIPALREHMLKESGWTMLCFAQALAMLGDEAGRSVLTSASSDASSAKQRAYGMAMRYEAGESSLLPALRALLDERDDRAREIVFRCLARLAPMKEKDLLSDILARGDMISVKMVLERLSDIKPADRDEILSKAFESSEDKRKALFSLATASPASAKQLLSAIDSLHLRDCFVILMKSLSKSGRKPALKTLEALLAEPGITRLPDVRCDIVRVIGFSGPDKDGKAAAMLEPFLESGSDELSLCAALSVLRLQYQK
jgi:HEAT repeat protein